MKFKKRIVREEEVITVHKDGVVAVEFWNGTGGLEYFFVGEKCFTKYKEDPKYDNPVDAIMDIENKYVHFNKNQFKQLHKMLSQGFPFYDVWNASSAKNALKLIQRKTFRKEDLLVCDFDSHTFYKLDHDLPWSRPYYNYYIGGITNKYYKDLPQLVKHIKKNKCVWNVKLVDIPYYISSSSCSKAVEFSVQFPQKTHDQLVKAARIADDEGYIKPEKFVHPTDTSDPLKIKKFLKNRSVS